MYCIDNNASDDHPKRQEVKEMKLQHTDETLRHSVCVISIMADFNALYLNLVSALLATYKQKYIHNI